MQRLRSPSSTFAVKATSGMSFARRHLAHRSHRRVAIHARHHDVHEHEIELRRPFKERDALLAALRGDRLDADPLKQREQGEDVAEIVVHHHDLHASQIAAGLVLDGRQRFQLGSLSCPRAGVAVG